MDSLIGDIISEKQAIEKRQLPPVFGSRLKKRRKIRKKMPKDMMRKAKILFDSELRSKASSVISRSPPISFPSRFKTSRLAHMPGQYVSEVNERNLKFSPQFSSVYGINKSQNLSYEASYLRIESKLKLPSIHKSAIISWSMDASGLFLEGNKKEIRERSEMNRLGEEVKKKEHREVALGTDCITEESDKISTGNETLNEFLKKSDKMKLRRSSFTFSQDSALS
jgi:hypothetical protein